MAADEWLLQQTAATGEPALRLYGWCEPTLSLGYFQKLTELPDDWREIAARLVRRPTGGGAILHHHEATYAVTAPSVLADGAALYDLLNAAVLSAVGRLCRDEAGTETEINPAIPALPAMVRGAVESERAQRGAFFCFERPGSIDIIGSSGKLAGGAQRRLSGATLQHGSLMLEATQPGSTSLREVCGRAVNYDETVAALAAGVAEVFGVELRERAFSEDECRQIAALAASRHADAGWLEHGHRKARQ